jgi:putative DNA primase/helicase
MHEQSYHRTDAATDAAQARVLAMVGGINENTILLNQKMTGGTGAAGHSAENPKSEAIFSAHKNTSASGAAGAAVETGRGDGIPHCRLHEENGLRGLYFFDYKPSRGGELIELAPEFVCGELHVMAHARDTEGRGWAYVLTLKDDDGLEHRITVPRASILGDGMELLRELSDRGLTVSLESDMSRELRRYIQFTKPESHIRRASKTGWQGDTFVLPDESIGPNGSELVEFQHSGGDGAHVEVGGDFDMWRGKVSVLCQDNTRLALAISATLAGPCLELAGMAGGGFHFRGGSSIGKSTALIVASSICGPREYMRSWRSTDNALEGVATMHSGLALCLDEIGELDPRIAGSTAYMIANGRGKGRASKDGSARKSKSWTTMLLSTGERSLADLTSEGGKRPMAGQEVRVVDIAADAAKDLGIFDVVPDGVSPGAFADELKAVTAENYGHALPMFLRHIVTDMDGFRERLLFVKAMGFDKLMELAPNAGGQVQRVAERFAIAAAAGEMATDAGITGWSCGAAYRAAAACFQTWLAGRGTTGEQEPAQMRKQVSAFLDTHEEGRFTDLNASDPESKRAIINRAGWRGLDDGASIYYVVPAVFEGEVCKGFDPVAVCAALIEVAALKHDRDKRTIKKTIGNDRPRVYAILKNVLEDAD